MTIAVVLMLGLAMSGDPISSGRTSVQPPPGTVAVKTVGSPVPPEKLLK